MKRFFLLAATFLAISLAAFSQERQVMEEGKVEFKPHAFIQLQGGVAHTLGEAKFADLISPAAALNLGYKFNPVFGMRLGASGWEGKGGWVAPAQLYSFKFLCQPDNISRSVGWQEMNRTAIFNGLHHRCRQCIYGACFSDT